MKEHLIEQRQKIARPLNHSYSTKKTELNAKKVQIESEIEQLRNLRMPIFKITVRKRYNIYYLNK